MQETTLTGRNSVRHRLAMVALLAVFFCQSLVSLSSQSATFDEVQYFGIGKYLLKNHTWDVMGAILHPPLSFYLNSIPLLFVHEDPRLWEYEEKNRDISFLGAVDLYRGQGLLAMHQNDHDRLLIVSRLLFSFLSVLLGYYLYRFSCDMFGRQGGLLPLLLFAFCPNMLAYSGLIVPDMPLTTFSFIAVYYLWRSFKAETVMTQVLSGVFLGLALLAKFTALLLVPVFILLIVLSGYREKRRMLRVLSVIPGIALLVLLAGYGFDPVPFFQGISFQFMHAREDGHVSFLLGKYSAQGWWYYYPVVFLLKTPIPALGLIVASLIMCLKKPVMHRFDLLFLLVPATAIGMFFCINHQSVGIRYILPIYPFMFAMTGVLSEYVGKAKYAVYVLVLWHAASSLSIAPHYLAYFNELAGGPDNGYKYLVDSNLDWGQDLKGLKKYMDGHGIKRISLSYFGADSPQRYGISYDWLPSHHLFNPEPEKAPPLPSDQLIAISATNLQGLYLDDREMYKWLLQYKPVAKIGYSIFIYDIGREPPISH